MLNNEERIIGAFIYNKNDTLILTTKMGMVKRTLMKDYEVQRCNKPIVAMRLKDNDELVCVNKDKGNVVLVTENGYYLNYKSEEIPVIGAKASGVKGINLKEDIVKSMISYNDELEYLTIFTDNKTAKRVKLSDLEKHSRAKKGNLIMKKTKTVIYKILVVLGTSARDLILTKADSEINILKNSDIAIMDLASTGSSISKYKLDTAAKVALKEKVISEEDKKENEEDIKKEVKPMTMADFIDDFKI